MNPNIFIADHGAALPFRPQYAVAGLGEPQTKQVQQQMCDVEVRQFQELDLKAKQQSSEPGEK
jgi:hypothetical protein